MNCQRVPIQWPQQAKLIQILDDLEVDYPEAIEIVGRLNIFKPYLLQISYDSQFDFLYVLNGLLTRLVFTPRNEWDAFVSRMVAAICESEQLTDNYNIRNTEEISSNTEVVTHVEAQEKCGDISDVVETTPPSPEPLGLKCDGLSAAPRSIDQGSSITPVPQVSHATALRQVTKKTNCSATKLKKTSPRQAEGLGRKDDADVKKITLAADALHLQMHESRAVNRLMKNVNGLKRSNPGEYRRQVLDAKYKFFRSAEAMIPTGYDPKATDLFILQELTTHLADTDWIWFRGLSKKAHRLTFMILDRRK